MTDVGTDVLTVRQALADAKTPEDIRADHLEPIQASQAVRQAGEALYRTIRHTTTIVQRTSGAESHALHALTEIPRAVDLYDKCAIYGDTNSIQSAIKSFEYAVHITDALERPRPDLSDKIRALRNAVSRARSLYPSTAQPQQQTTELEPWQVCQIAMGLSYNDLPDVMAYYNSQPEPIYPY